MADRSSSGTSSTVRFSASNSPRASATNSGASSGPGSSGTATRTVVAAGSGAAAGEPAPQRATTRPADRSSGSVTAWRPHPSAMSPGTVGPAATIAPPSAVPEGSDGAASPSSEEESSLHAPTTSAIASPNATARPARSPPVPSPSTANPASGGNRRQGVVHEIGDADGEP